jgi:hypothetical protein
MSEPNTDQTTPQPMTALTALSNPQQQPQQPQASQAQPAAQPAAPSAQPQASQAQPAAQPAAKPAAPPTPKSLHASIYEGVLKTLGGGPIMVNGKEVPQTKGQLGKSILAGALAGMFGGMGARDAEGRHDPGKAAQQGFQATTEMRDKRQAAFQQAADADISRRQMVMKNNLDLMHQQIAMTHMNHQELDVTAENNNKGILADADEFDKNLTGTDVNDPTKRAVQGRGLTYKEALDKLHGNWSNTLAIVDGSLETRGQNGEMEVEPTYAVLNPAVSIKMSAEQAAAMAKFKPAYQNVYEDTGGNFKIPMHRYVADVHQLNSLNQMQSFLENAKDQLGVKNAPDLAAIARKGGQPILDTVKQAENAIAQGGDPVDALRRLSGTGAGAQILKEMGITNEQVENLVNERDRKAALAKQGGMGPKAPMPDDTVDSLLAATDASNIPPETKTAIHAGAKKDKDGHYNLNMQQGEDMRNRLLAAQNQTAQINERTSLANGDPVQMNKTAQNTVEGDVNDITKIASMRGNARTNAVNAIHDQAAALGLNTQNYSESALESQANMYKDYTGGQRTPTGKQLVSFDAYISHTGEALAAQERLASKYMGLYHQPILNKTMKELGVQLTDDKDWAAYSASLEPVKHEIENFLSAGFATKSEDAEAMRAILNDTMPLDRMDATLKQLAMTADARLAALGKPYTSNMGRNYDHLLSPESKKTLDKLNITSQSDPYTAKLPRGWNNHQLTPLKDVKVAVQFLKAAGGNKAEAAELMKRNGWSE